MSSIDFFHNLKFLRNKNGRHQRHNPSPGISTAESQRKQDGEEAEEEPKRSREKNKRRNRRRGQHGRRRESEGGSFASLTPPLVNCPKTLSSPEYPEQMDDFLQQRSNSPMAMPMTTPTAPSTPVSPMTPVTSTKSAGTVTERLAQLRSACQHQKQDTPEPQQEEFESYCIEIMHEYFTYQDTPEHGPEWIVRDGSELPPLPPDLTSASAHVDLAACLGPYVEDYFNRKYFNGFAEAQFSEAGNDVDACLDSGADYNVDIFDASTGNCSTDVACTQTHHTAFANPSQIDFDDKLEVASSVANIDETKVDNVDVNNEIVKVRGVSSEQLLADMFDQLRRLAVHTEEIDRRRKLKESRAKFRETLDQLENEDLSWASFPADY